MNNEEKILEVPSQVVDRLDRIEADVSALKTDVAELKTDVAELKTDMRAVRDAYFRMEIDINRKLDMLLGMREETEDLVADHENRIRRLEQAAVGQ